MKTISIIVTSIVLVIAGSCRPAPQKEKRIVTPESRDKTGKLTRAAVTWVSDGSAENVQWIHDHCANVDPIPTECLPYLAKPSTTPTPNSPTPTPAVTATATPTATRTPTPLPTLTPTVTVTPGLPPSPPSSLTARVVRGKDVELKWQDNASDETAYEVQRSTEADNDPTYVTSVMLPANSVTWTDSTTLKKQSYWYRVRCNRQAVHSGWSNVFHIQP